MGNYLRSCMALFCLCLIQTTMAVENNYRVGVGIYDITGPAAEVNLFGYASSDQFSTGIHDRQWSRAFVIAEPVSEGNRVVFVTVDQGAVFQGVTQGVLKKLKARYGDLYNDDNLIISATHTHGGAGGHSHYALYNVTRRRPLSSRPMTRPWKGFSSLLCEPMNRWRRAESCLTVANCGMPAPIARCQPMRIMSMLPSMPR